MENGKGIVMTTRRMTSQEWANIYGLEWDQATKMGRFWLLLLVMLLAGIAAGIYAVPAGMLPGTGEQDARLEAVQSQVDELEAEVSALEQSDALEQKLRDSVHQNVVAVNAEMSKEVFVDEMTIGVIYTIQDPDSDSCVEFFTFEEASGDLKSVRVSPVYSC